MRATPARATIFTILIVRVESLRSRLIIWTTCLRIEARPSHLPNNRQKHEFHGSILKLAKLSQAALVAAMRLNGQSAMAASGWPTNSTVTTVISSDWPNSRAASAMRLAGSRLKSRVRSNPKSSLDLD